MRVTVALLCLAGSAYTASAAQYAKFRYLESSDFRIIIDAGSGALLSIVNPHDNASMSWISGPEDTPWQPAGSRWGLGYVNLGPLHRSFWQDAIVTFNGNRVSAAYALDGLDVNVTRTLNRDGVLEECYVFTNTGAEPLALDDHGPESFAIYTPFNDHYTSTTDVLEHRAHAHVWANGGASSWVKLTRMGLRGPHLGIVLTQGALQGYSIEGRSRLTSSDTRGIFLLHPAIPTLESGGSGRVCWELFWHEDWDEFFKKAKQRSSQFLHVTADRWTAAAGETVNLTVSGQRSGEAVVLNGQRAELQLVPSGNDSYSTTIQADKQGEQEVSFTVGESEEQTNSTITINVVPDIDTLIANRVKFITTNQQLSLDFPDESKAGAYAVYDNQMEGIVTFDTSSDRNTGRERVGMGVLIARWLQQNPNSSPDIEDSLRIYYDYVNNKLQETDGYVRSWPIGATDGSLRLYNWPWVMQLHLQMAKLGNKEVTSHGDYKATPSQRLLVTIERFYAEPEAIDYYPINLPIHESLVYFTGKRDEDTVARLLTLFTAHGDRITSVGSAYPSSEVNYEQSIIAPAAIILLELYRSTNESRWLDAAHGHFDRLEAFSGRQPNFHLHDVAIRHWDGYWFGKDRMWGDTFPHYWSTLTAIAMHHYAVATGDEHYSRRAEGILRANLVLFDEEGRGYCAFIYPTSVDGRPGSYLDPYANDQDWALAHLLALREDGLGEGDP
ncbi:hypothetical protein AN7241.2 [Aspergillus nidulans FGSC A4]|uniref:Six-hairpin glycosidase-like protein n=1 Tax=Emericella nidulans (strain FGSC A4 / ATCC 38163 / CBS 112.46 / NRRL 194 / M139) TaxID=227321 RepID=Q5AWT9_EMENI|nr:hypothetical protein [Aspergillus nidulans FGSC A4]EAA61288.1 hypothetical protein AN7241.2 [Aspergillus nidulans FGSC A4]CBF78786.1 TPA: conserved hypothetical protein [Aspergillus nidulans FGSC A4]|eukprot:XP_680510.1 hypothetical protein AN7241.2 [Aspergillus nidulans FGSC A4]